MKFRVAAVLILFAGCSASEPEPRPEARASAPVSKPPAPPENPGIRRLIDSLLEVSQGGIGFMATTSGTKFSPVEEEGRPQALLLGQAPPADSEALRRLVALGATAVPCLIDHLDDIRPTKLTVEHTLGIGGMFLDDEYDFNARTAKALPAEVNRRFSGSRNGNSHTVTVGDLCFVALGQIVNRSFNAVRYQPTACIMVNSPTRSEALRGVVWKEWGGLTPERHRLSLIEDVRRPDERSRRSEGMKRLVFYYPKDAEEVALQELERPLYCAFKIEAFARQKLYATPEPGEWKRMTDEFVAFHGPAFRDGLLAQLRNDRFWRTQDYGVKWKADPKDALAHLFPGVDADKPVWHDSFSQHEQGEFIETLVPMRSRAVDEALAAALRSLGSGRFVDHGDDYLALACMKVLLGRGYDGEIERHCAARAGKAETWGRELEALRRRVPRGK